ncbi:uncharacterized protein LOC110529345 isoform X8 [Oncorhynchus mykiss]|uniref:uncharacterized protein LOC110529345 isoform X8 n=1 Tax=Oncorhynchus mykiss TaxID=8022 RepID=UPI001877AFF4|nr:uncharacterized protein LOC110529345 isoform X8 [Oncorhynchus mykiss]
MAQIIEGDRRRSGQTGKSLCQCQSPHDNDNVVMHDPECNAILELDSSESSEESSEEEIVKCSTEPEVVGPAMELERRCEEMRRRNEALLKRFKEVEEDRRRAERRGAALLPKSTKLVKTSYSAHTTDVSDQWESLTITVMNQVPTQDTRLVARRSNGGRRQPKSRRLEDRLEKRCGDEKNILEERQLIICTIDNGEVMQPGRCLPLRTPHTPRPRRKREIESTSFCGSLVRPGSERMQETTALTTVAAHRT